MFRIWRFALLSLAAVVSAQMESLDPCGVDCYNQALNKAGAFNCGANDLNCLCRVPDFGFAIRDCAEGACPPGYAPTVTNSASAMCATFTAAPTTTQALTTTTPAPTTTETPTSASSSSEISSTTSSSTASATLSTSTTPATTPSTTSPSTFSSALKPSSTSTTSATAPAATTSPTEPSSSGLSDAAKIGVGVGVTAAILVLIGVAGCFFLRRGRGLRGGLIGGGGKPAMPNHRYKISAPMPSAEQHPYTSNKNNNSEWDIGSGGGAGGFGGDGELEMKSRRYEDMLPRQQPEVSVAAVQPRQMV